MNPVSPLASVVSNLETISLSIGNLGLLSGRSFVLLHIILENIARANLDKLNDEEIRFFFFGSRIQRDQNEALFQHGDATCFKLGTLNERGTIFFGLHLVELLSRIPNPITSTSGSKHCVNTKKSCMLYETSEENNPFGSSWQNGTVCLAWGTGAR